MLDTSQKLKKNDADPIFVTANILKEIFVHIPLFSLSKKKSVLDQNLS